MSSFGGRHFLVVCVWFVFLNNWELYFHFAVSGEELLLSVSQISGWSLTPNESVSFALQSLMYLSSQYLSKVGKILRCLKIKLSK